MKNKILILILLAGLFLTWTGDINAASVEDPLVYIRDLTRIEGVRDNMLMGVGLVIGLNGTGDSRFSPTFQMMENMLDEYGIVAGDLDMKNAAAVMVTTTLPPFARSGDRLDVNVSSMGDAKSLQGGTLLMTALKAPNGQIYAAAQGSISVGGFGASGGGGGNSVQKNHLQVGRVPNGAIVEQTLEPDFSNKKEISFILKRADTETATLIQRVINDHFRFARKKREELAKAVNSGRIQVRIPPEYRGKVINFIGQIEGLKVRASMPPKIIINERTGTIVMGHGVSISTTAVAHGNLTVTISTQETTIAAEDEENNEEVVVQQENTQVNVEEEKNRLMKVEKGTTIGQVVKALNAIGATPRDIIAILQAMKQAGAVHAELEMI